MRCKNKTKLFKYFVFQRAAFSCLTFDCRVNKLSIFIVIIVDFCLMRLLYQKNEKCQSVYINYFYFLRLFIVLYDKFVLNLCKTTIIFFAIP